MLAGTNFDRLSEEDPKLNEGTGGKDGGSGSDPFDGGLWPISTGWDTRITF